MENIQDVLKKAEHILNEKLAELEQLEIEKADIISRFKKADEKEKAIVENEMKDSEKKFNNLLEEVKIINEKIRKIRRRFCWF